MPRFISRHRVIICSLFVVSLPPPALAPVASGQWAGHRPGRRIQCSWSGLSRRLRPLAGRGP
jgi:hypothetical protein